MMMNKKHVFLDEVMICIHYENRSFHFQILCIIYTTSLNSQSFPKRTSGCNRKNKALLTNERLKRFYFILFKTFVLITYYFIGLLSIIMYFPFRDMSVWRLLRW